MAYTRRNPTSCPLAIGPGVLSLYVPYSSAETNLDVRVPWDNVRLTHAECVTLEVVDSGDLEIDLEIVNDLGEQVGSTEAMTITVATSGSAVGTVTAATFYDESLCSNINENYKVRVEVDGDDSGSVGAQMLFMYFEAVGQ